MFAIAVASGCRPPTLAPPPPPPPPPPPAPARIQEQISVNYDSGSAELTPAAKARLDDAAEVLKQNDLAVVVEGHADSSGSGDVNQRLAAQRAEEVRNYLIDRGVRPGQVFAKSSGERSAVASNDVADGRAANRRADLGPARGETTPGHPVRVFYGTDRMRTGLADPARIYGSTAGELETGICTVSIPPTHSAGRLETPFLHSYGVSVFADPKRHVLVVDTEPLDPDVFWRRLRESVEQKPDKQALVFVHGYNVSFEDAARRTAQLAYDLQMEHGASMFSWPSQASELEYVRDLDEIRYARPHLEEFLRSLASRSGAERIHLVAHSMGSQLVADTLVSMAAPGRGPNVSFNQVVLSAPDIETRLFKRDIAAPILGTATRVTVYASSNDRALRLSRRWYHGHPRVGESGTRLLLLPGIDTVDASNVETDFYGHSYFASRPVVADLAELLRNGTAPDDRKLKKKTRRGQRYWAFAPGITR